MPGAKSLEQVNQRLDATADAVDAEKRLRKSGDQYRLLFEANPSPVWVLDLQNFSFLAVNEATIKHYGYSREEFFKMTALDIRPQEEIPRFLSLMKQYAQDPQIDKKDRLWKHKKKDGTIIDVEVFSQELVFEERPARLILINDVTISLQAQESLELLMEVTATANETEDLHEMITLCLEKICKIRKWAIGQAWFIDPEQNVLFCSHSFYSEIDAMEFRRQSLQRNLAKGVDLPGRVWQDGVAIWIPDVREQVSERYASLLHYGLKSGFAFPIQSQERKLSAIFEFFAEAIRPPNADFLVALRKLARHLSLVFDRKQEQEKIRYQATHDPLTGLPNRLLFQDRFTQALAQASRKAKMLAIFMLDLDNFKTINDSMGHAIGDLLLQSIAQRLSKTLREVDTIARMGGDELIMLVPDLQHVEDAAKVGQRVLNAFDQPFFIEGNELHMTTSVGISIYPHDGENSQSLLKNVDVALYRAKEKGRNNYQLYTPSMTAAALARLSMENSLRKALQRNEFLLYYQPQFELSTGKPVAIEALLRWQHPEMGLCLPAEFLPLAEETGLITPIWEWCLFHACEQMKKWREMGLQGTVLTMNIPPSQFQLQSLSQTIFSILNRTKLDPDELELEITEAMARKELFMMTLVGELKTLGIRVALDDFGTGYTSLSYLKEIRMDTIKIDPYFIRSVHSDSTDQAIVRAVITLARGMKVRVVAEGVETREQMETLRLLGCDAIQGFLLCRPASEENLTKLFQSGQLHL